jgi:hypothetical protein
MNKIFRNEVPLREPRAVMKLDRMGSMFPTRMSFMRTLLRQLSKKRALINRAVWEIDEDGFGHAVYTINIDDRMYSLVAFTNYLNPEDRTDRVIAEAWDSSYVLYDGVPEIGDIVRLNETVPRQELGRFTINELVLSRANKSLRLFSHVVEALKKGNQPDKKMVKDIGYLMRTTAVYGNGKFGIADRNKLIDRDILSGPFMAEMLTVWLIRGFTHDLVEHLGGSKLDRNIKSYLGVGNATGLGMAPFLVSHPELLSNWMMARETGLTRVRALQSLTQRQLLRITQLADRVVIHLDEWQVTDEQYQRRIKSLRIEWKKVYENLEFLVAEDQPIHSLVKFSEQFSLDCQELVVAFVLEPFGDLIDGLTCCMTSGEPMPLNPKMSIKELEVLIEERFGWAIEFDFNLRSETAQFWYVSEEKLEPRLGLRYEEQGGELESPLDIARQVKLLRSDLTDNFANVGEFLRKFPAHRSVLRRIQIMDSYPYSEIQDNMISENCRPIDMLRCKLAYFGAAKFDPKSDRWVRVTLAQGAPLFNELDGRDDWWLPVFAA